MCGCVVCLRAYVGSSFNHYVFTTGACYGPVVRQLSRVLRVIQRVHRSVTGVGHRQGVLYNAPVLRIDRIYSLLGVDSHRLHHCYIDNRLAKFRFKHHLVFSATRVDHFIRQVSARYQRQGRLGGQVEGLWFVALYLADVV